jgi:nucleotide-binding universal stress UspA family protein
MAFKHLLVPTDFSEPANNALRYAIEEAELHHAEEAELHHAKVTLLHVLPADTRTDVHYVTGAPTPAAQGGLGPGPVAPRSCRNRRLFAGTAARKC